MPLYDVIVSAELIYSSGGMIRRDICNNIDYYLLAIINNGFKTWRFSG
jgi:hypothetical protein